MRAFTLADERDVAEVIIVVAAIVVFLWFGRRVFSGFDVLFGISLLVMLAYSHRRAHEGWREIGFRSDTFWPTLRLLLPVVLVGCIAVWAPRSYCASWGHRRRTSRQPGLRHSWRSASRA
jgi:hypothetical protein